MDMYLILRKNIEFYILCQYHDGILHSIKQFEG